MTLKIAINGFGRIGRLVLRAFLEAPRPGIEIVAINDLAPLEDQAHLLAYDSVHGRLASRIQVESDVMHVGNSTIHVLQNANPATLPWKEKGVDLVFECSGRFTKRAQAAQHLEAGAHRVLISAPSSDADATVVYGVNHETLRPDHQVISNASCTTNCLAPVAQVLHAAIGIVQGHMTTIHAYTADQRLVDTAHSDPRRARAAAQSMVPTSTGAAQAVGLVLPELRGKLDGAAIRVPVANVSLVDFTFMAQRDTTADQINAALNAATEGRLKGVLAVNTLPLVSVDFNHDAHSSIADLTQTKVIDQRFCRVVAWYDNEWGFANRMLDVAAFLAHVPRS